MKKNKLTIYILVGMFLGIIVGYFEYRHGLSVVANEKATTGKIIDVATVTKGFAEKMNILTTVFLRLIQMVIAPLVFSTLAVGIAKLGDLKAVGRVGGRAMLWFITASIVSLTIGTIMVNVLHPGSGISLDAIVTGDTADIVGKTNEFSLNNFVTHVFPKSVIQAMAENEILQIVVFAIFFGLATAAIGEMGKIVVKALDAIAHVILKMVGYVMYAAPLGVFGSIAAVIATNGPHVFIFYGKYLFYFILAVAVLWSILLLVGWLFLKDLLPKLLKTIVQPMIIAFTTTSSEAVFPKLTEVLEKFGCSGKVVSFVLPLGYSFNLDGSMINMTFASMAIAQAYGIHLDLGTEITMMLVLMLTSKGMAGVPRASLVVVAAICGMFKIPPEGIALILPIDHFCDMFRTATNVLGNSLATTVVSKWEGDFERKPQELA